jgi:hypothetical protein
MGWFLICGYVIAIIIPRRGRASMAQGKDVDARDI